MRMGKKVLDDEALSSMETIIFHLRKKVEKLKSILIDIVCEIYIFTDRDMLI